MIIIGIILAFVLLLTFIGVGVIAYTKIKESDPNGSDQSTTSEMSTAQEFMPFEDIKDGMIIMGGHKYRAIIEASSVNYNLKTDKEKEVIEMSFQRFLNSLTFPITFFVQTKILDNTNMLAKLRGELLATIEKRPSLTNYANAYMNDMTNLSSQIGNNKQKKKYIIVPYEDAATLGNLSDQEKYEESAKDLYSRAALIVEGLSAVGIKATILNTLEVAEVVYAAYHKDNYSEIESIMNGEFASMLTKGEVDRINNVTDDAKMDWILYEAQMRIKNELVSKSLPDYIKEDFVAVIQELDKIRDSVGGYYKSASEVGKEKLNEKR